MQDIRKPYTRSKSNRNLYSRVEQFESGKYDDEDQDSYQSDDRTNDAPVRIPIKGGVRVRRDVNEMEMYPRHRGGGGDDSYSDYEDNSHADIHRKNGGVIRDPRTRYTRNKSSLGTWIFILVVVILVTVAGLLTYVFNKATITITPKYQDIDVRKTVTFTSGSSEGIPYITASTSITTSKALQLTETKKVEAKASGKVTIYNKFDTEPQRLIKNTRFESASGKIYRINESVTVPGKKGDTPGSVDVIVYADSYGADYNSSATDFTIPGFKGTPRYAGFFGRSQGPVTGGSSGNISSASIADINAAKDELALELGQKIKEKLLQVKQDGYIGFYSAIDLEYKDNEKEILQGLTSTYEVTATGYLILADELRLTQALATGVRDYANEPVRLGNSETLTYSIKDTVNLSTATSVDVLIEGNPRIIWVTSSDEIQRLFAGKSRNDFKTIMGGITSIEGGEIGFSPMWLSAFPSDISKIYIVEKLPKR